MISEPARSLIKEPPLIVWKLIHTDDLPASWMISFIRPLRFVADRKCRRGQCWWSVVMQQQGGGDCASTMSVGLGDASAETLVSESPLILREVLPFLNIVQHFSCFIRGPPSSWSALSHLNYLLEHRTPVWNPQIYFSDSEGNTCCVYFSPPGSISSPVE